MLKKFATNAGFPHLSILLPYFAKNSIVPQANTEADNDKGYFPNVPEQVLNIQPTYYGLYRFTGIAPFQKIL